MSNISAPDRDRISAATRHDRIEDGFVAAIDICGQVLEQNFPP